MRVLVRTAAALLVLAWVAAPVSAQAVISWSSTGRQFHFTAGEPIAVVCPPGGELGRVWGSTIYTDDSSVCTAAAHAGVIAAAEGGTFVLRIVPGRESYTGSRRNGVTSSRRGSWETSFTVYREPEPPPEPELEPEPEPPPPDIPEEIAWDQTASRLAPNGRRFTFECPSGGIAAVVKGHDLYSWDSSICTAAVHSGAITLEGGGIVTIEMRPGARGYAASTRNGIASATGDHTILGFVIIVDPAFPDGTGRQQSREGTRG